MLKLLSGAMMSVVFAGLTITSFVQQNNGSFQVVAITFFLIGILLSAIGLKQTIHEKNIRKNGMTTYGIVTDVKNSMPDINNTPAQIATIEVMLSGGVTKAFKKELGFRQKRYKKADILEVQYYKGDISIINRLKREHVMDIVIRKLDQCLVEQKG